VLALIASLATTSLAVAFLKGSVGIPNASSRYLVALAVTIRFGIPGAILPAVASVLVYRAFAGTLIDPDPPHRG